MSKTKGGSKGCTIAGYAERVEGDFRRCEAAKQCVDHRTGAKGGNGRGTKGATARKIGGNGALTVN